MSTSIVPQTGFARFALGPSLQRAITEIGFVEPRPIQAGTIPAALAGRDILGLAQTGTGKTAAFALPLLERILKEKKPGFPRALIIAPTRELANQIEAEIRLLAKFTSIRTMTIYGGVNMNRQIDDLRRRPEIIVACPGRLLDLMHQRVLRLDAVEALVLDEADHMFDMGFLPDIRRILAALPARRQNLLYSATMPGEIRHLADRLLQNPHVVELSHSKPAETIEHSFYPVDENAKVDLLRHLLHDDAGLGAAPASAIVFTRTKHRAKRLALQLSKARHRAVALQGNMSQSQRDRAMSGFRDGTFDILVATDIAARGIDVAEISHIINFDVPMTPDAYTHRVGRTGRAECKGRAFTFVTDNDREIVHDIERMFGARIPRVNVQGFARTAPSRAATQPPRTPQPQRTTQARGRFQARGASQSYGRRNRGC